MTTEKPRRRWLQFRLRTLLIVMTLFVIPFSWIGSEMAQRRREKAVIAWVEKMGGSVILTDGWLDEWMSGTVQTVDLTNTPVDDLSPLAGLKNLTRLTLESTQVNDLSPLAGLKNLQLLTLHDTPVSDLTPLAGLKNLESLGLDNTKVSEEQVRVLQKAILNRNISHTMRVEE